VLLSVKEIQREKERRQRGKREEREERERGERERGWWVFHTLLSKQSHCYIYTALLSRKILHVPGLEDIILLKYPYHLIYLKST
jgi:hypothetical protein